MMPEMDGFMLAEEIRRHPELVGATLMMLSSADRRDNAARCRELGVSAYLTKPIRQADLLNAILTTVDAEAREESRAGRRTLSSLGPCTRRLRLLLAEDNLVNQRLAIRLLEKRGHAVVVVGNGREALAALEKERFDAVLMDVQMPEMDGFEATRVIRARERDHGGHVPIVAMTAHAMKGDRERCLKVGMDGYISKPLQPTELYEAVESTAVTSNNPPPPPDRGERVFDEAVALATVGGDREFLREIVALFLRECPAWLAQIRDGIAGSDSGAVRLAAHTLKGSVAGFGAAAARDLAQKLEDMGITNNLGGAGEAHAQLEQAVEMLRAELSRI
jgi:CheY-like chemotaxis protein/HPt (histidine-containing phosphotransfer) domain-containing protein